VKLLLLMTVLMATGCGYHFTDTSKDAQTTISVPFIKGDSEGILINELVLALSASGQFEYSRYNGNLTLHVSILSSGDERIGYRYDRNPVSGKLRDNIVGTENRETVAAEVKLVDNYSCEILFGPEIINATADYDYVDSNSIRDLVFFNSDGKPQTVLDFSLGQLDSVDGGHDDARLPVYRSLAQKIVDGLILRDGQLPH